MYKIGHPKDFPLQKPTIDRLNDYSDIFSQLTSSIQSHTTDPNLKKTFSLYHQLGMQLAEHTSEFDQFLSLHCMSLLIGEIYTQLSIRNLEDFPAKFKNLILISLKKLLRILKSSQLSPNSFIKACTKRISALIQVSINCFLEFSPEISSKLMFQLINTTELLSEIKLSPFLIILQAALNIIDKSESLQEPINFCPVTFFFVKKEEPFLPDYQHKEYTLVLDLDQTLGHLHQGVFYPRPGVTKFIQETNLNFQLVLFTAGSSQHAQRALKVIDPNRCIRLVLDNQHTDKVDRYVVKDLRKLGRDLSKVVIVDNLRESFMLQPENGVLISSWCGDTQDRELVLLKEILQQILIRKEDVRISLKYKYNQF